jgi:hypothetical protein
VRRESPEYDRSCMIECVDRDNGPGWSCRCMCTRWICDMEVQEAGCPIVLRVDAGMVGLKTKLSFGGKVTRIRYFLGPISVPS